VEMKNNSLEKEMLEKKRDSLETREKDVEKKVERKDISLLKIFQHQNKFRVYTYVISSAMLLYISM
jgi:hypothetical protein